jgi:hypothetical protein
LTTACQRRACLAFPLQTDVSLSFTRCTMAYKHI